MASVLPHRGSTTIIGMRQCFVMCSFGDDRTLQDDLEVAVLPLFEEYQTQRKNDRCAPGDLLAEAGRQH